MLGLAPSIEFQNHAAVRQKAVLTHPDLCAVTAACCLELIWSVARGGVGGSVHTIFECGILFGTL